MRRAAFPTPPPKRLRDASLWFFHAEDGREDGAVVEEVVITDAKVQAEVRAMASGAWGVVCTTPAAMELQLPAVPLPWVEEILPPVQGKVHILTNHPCILELDTVAASISAIRLPGSVVATTRNFKVSRSQDLGLFLVHAKGSLLSVWHHRIGSNGARDWVQVAIGFLCASRATVGRMFRCLRLMTTRSLCSWGSRQVRDSCAWM